MSFRFANKTVFSSLALLAMSSGLLSCGGGGGDEVAQGDLPNGCELVLQVHDVVDPNDNKRWLTITIEGNGGAYPEVSINGASNSPDLAMNSMLVQYTRERNSKTAHLGFDGRVISGTWVAAGPVTINEQDYLNVDGVITFNTGNELESDHNASFAGHISLQCRNVEEQGEGWAQAEGFNKYTAQSATVDYKAEVEPN